jgi:hypothetical protein
MTWQGSQFGTRVLTRDEAAAASAAAVTERDTVQANLLDLDGSFGKRLLAGASLTGVSQQRWDTAAAALAALWETFGTYSAVVERAAELLARTRRPAAPQLAELTRLLTGPSVKLTRPAAPLRQRNLTAPPEVDLTLTAAVREMTRAFTDVADVVTAAERVWNEAGGLLEQAGNDLTEARRRAGQLTDPAFTGELAGAEAELGQLRDMLGSDPLSLWRGDRVDTAEASRVRERAAQAVTQAIDLARLREDAQSQTDAVAAAVAAAREAWQVAMAACERAAQRIAAASMPILPQVDNLTARLAALTGLTAAGNWRQLASELGAIKRQAAAVASQCREAEQAALALLDRRNELRGLLDAYHARAARLGAVEDADLGARYVRARDLLWSAPCDLTAAASAVTSYQQAVLALRGRGHQA